MRIYQLDQDDPRLRIVAEPIDSGGRQFTAIAFSQHLVHGNSLSISRSASGPASARYSAEADVPEALVANHFERLTNVRHVEGSETSFAAAELMEIRSGRPDSIQYTSTVASACTRKSARTESAAATALARPTRRHSRPRPSLREAMAADEGAPAAKGD
ncbi:hypothetical protein AB0M22_32730 [Nocardia sp. NPDC051756]|uniref:hypothetical protein n=1 Tax=Nocardia sp. NPDC051756 TaxID=3154751 RepID=UPI00341F1E1C